MSCLLFVTLTVKLLLIIRKGRVSRGSETISLTLSHPLDSASQGVASLEKRSQLLLKAIELQPSRSSRLTLSSTIRKKAFYPLKREFRLSSIVPLSSSDETAQCSYNYAAPSSSFTPASMKLRQNPSLLSCPFCSHRVQCVGLQRRDIPRESDLHSDILLDYKL